MKSEILHLLRHADGSVSGQQLCETFGVSRTAVWKVINQLKEEGYVIDSVQNKGYRITEYPDIITCLLYTSPSPRDRTRSRMPSSA